jgi:RES domain-containing protein
VSERRFRRIRIDGTWYRIVRRGRDPLDFSRTQSAGGRYHAPRSYPVLYLGDQPATCLLEVLVHAFELPPTYDLVAVGLVLPRVVDLATAAGLKTARISVKDLVGPPKPVADDEGVISGTRYGLTWQLGRAAWARGADGLLVPSAAFPAQRVLVVFEREKTHLEIRGRRPVPTDPRMRRLFESR